MKLPRPAPVLLLLLLLLLPVVAALAAPPVKLAEIEGVTEYRYANGLRLVLVPDPALTTVLVHLTYLVGSRHEGYGEKGMAHLLEHMLFKGTGRIPDLKAEFMRRGARWNGTTSFDRTTYFQTLPADGDNLDWTLMMEADRMLNARILREVLDTEMTVVRNEFEQGENSPAGVLFQRMLQMAFPWHNYGNPVIGARSDIEGVSMERMLAFYRTWYQPDNLVLIIGGRFDTAEAIASVTRHFGGLPRPVRPLPTFPTEEPTQDGERSVVLRRVGDNQIVAAMYRIPAAMHPEYPAIDVLAHVLGHAPTGRLHRALVRPGLASWVWGGERGLHDPGFAYFGANVASDGPLEAAREALLDTLENLARDPVTDEEVERSRTALLNDYERTQRELPAYVRALSEFSALGDWRLYYIYRDRLRAVTTAEVRRAAATYLRPANRVLGQFIPSATPERAEIPRLGPLDAVIAAYRPGAAPEAGEALDPDPLALERRIERRMLANGIRAAFLPRRTRGNQVVISMGLYWGDEDSRAGRSVACSLATQMLSRGTAKRSRAGFRDALEKLQASLTVGMDGLTLEVRREHLPAALALAAEALRMPAFAESEFEELRRAALTGAEARRSDPGAQAVERVMRHLAPYPEGHWLATQTLAENIAALRRVTPDEARRCHAELLGASGADLAAAGDFAPDELAALIERLFGDWRTPSPYRRIAARHFERPALRETIATPDRANAALRGGLNLAMRDDHPDFPALVVANWLLGGNPAGRLPLRLREKEGLSYSVWSQFGAGARDAAGSFAFGAIYAPQNRDRIERALREELERVLQEGFAADEVERARHGLLEARRIGRGTDRALAARMQSQLFLGRSFAWDLELEKRIAALDATAVNAAVRRHLDLSRLSLVLAGDFK